MTQSLKAPNSKPDSRQGPKVPSPGFTHRRSGLLQVVLWPPHLHRDTHPPTQSHTLNKCEPGLFRKQRPSVYLRWGFSNSSLSLLSKVKPETSSLKCPLYCRTPRQPRGQKRFRDQEGVGKSRSLPFPCTWESQSQREGNDLGCCWCRNHCFPDFPDRLLESE